MIYKTWQTFCFVNLVQNKFAISVFCLAPGAFIRRNTVAMLRWKIAFLGCERHTVCICGQIFVKLAQFVYISRAWTQLILKKKKKIGQSVIGQSVIVYAMKSASGIRFLWNWHSIVAHLSTRRSRWAIVIDLCPVSFRPCVCPSVNNYLKNLLLWNRPTDFNETSQKWSLDDALLEHFKVLNSVKNSGFHGNRKNFKNLLVPNLKGYSFHIWNVASSSGPLPKYFKL